MFIRKHEELFWQLYNCKTEQDVDKLIHQRPDEFAQSNWYPLGGESSNFGVVENQQSNPVAALVEKLTNSIDAILMRRCYEEGIDPKSPAAPRSIDKAVRRFFPRHRNWDLTKERSEQARSIQILADGSRQDTSIIIYDDGEGQHSQGFAHTFLSLLRGNKNEIRFVQGKYNMGGTGAIAFCGRKRYQLIASKRYDGTGRFGFTLVRRHPLSQQEEEKFKNTWYEYLQVDGEIPAFDMQELDLGLHRRIFRTGTIIKLYSYNVTGNRLFNLDMARSLNEFLYEPALPIAIVESAQRYLREDATPATVIFGLKRRLEDSDYVEASFSQRITDRRMGKAKVTVYVFKVRTKGMSPRDTKSTIRNEYFKNKMQVLFSLSGQVHGHYTSEFISRTLQFNLLKDYLLIHVDCSEMKTEFRSELFMASRDRLKQSEESSNLRKRLGNTLKSGQLRDIYKQRKDRLSYNSADDESLLKQIAEDLPLNKDMQDLIKRAFDLDVEGKKKKPQPPRPKPPPPPFDPKRYPSVFRIDARKSDGEPVVEIPQGDSKTLTFESDVENQYFDRADNPGDLEFAIMTYTPNDASGGDRPGTVNDVGDIFLVIRKSPQDGKIKVVFEPTEDIKVGDEVQIRADLISSAEPENALTLMFWIKIVQPRKKPNPKPPTPDEKLGLPKHELVFAQAENGVQGVLTWKKLTDNTIEMNHDVVMQPFVEGEVLEKIYINMDSNVLKNFKGKMRNPSEEQKQLADRQYISRVYFHTLFLYVICKNRKYAFSQMNGDDNYDDVDLTDYLKDVFQSNYAEFLLNFETNALMEGLG